MAESAMSSYMFWEMVEKNEGEEREIHRIKCIYFLQQQRLILTISFGVSLLLRVSLKS